MVTNRVAAGRRMVLEPSPFQGVTLVGGGPGDVELLTLAGMRALLGADVVVHDRLGPVALLDELPPEVERINVAKVPRGAFTPQETINQVLLDKARQGLSVVRLKGGDGYVFGRGFEELLFLQKHGIAVRVVPGISSSLSVPALAGIPVTHRGVVHEFTVVSGHVPPGHPDSLVDWPALARMRGTVVAMMAVENAGAIARALLDGGRPAGQPVAVICDGSMPTQRILRTTLASLGATVRDEQVRPPAIIVVGQVASLRLPPGAAGPDDARGKEQ